MTDAARRLVASVLVALVAAGAVTLAADDPEPLAIRPATRQPGDGPVIPGDDVVASAWYCAEGTSSAIGRASETVIIGNLERHPIEFEMTVMVGEGAPSQTERAELEPYEQRRIPVRGLAESPEPGVVVEIFGGRAIVEHEIEGRDDIAVGPCSRTAARRWFFAEGSTERGAEDWLALFNPFGEDAIVDVTFLDEAGLEQPEAGQALVVPRRSRVSVAVHDIARRQGQVAVLVEARTGRIVAERSGHFDGTEGRMGITLSLGTTRAATRWRFPVMGGGAGTTGSVSIANLDDRRAQVEVQLLRAGGGRSTLPETVELLSDTIKRVDVGGRGGGDVYAVEIRSTNDVPVVAGAFDVWAEPAPVTAVAATQGSVTASPFWSFAVGRLEATGDAVISAVNLSREPVTVQLYAYTRGDPDSPASAPAEALGAGERVGFSLRERGIRPDQVLVVAADGPIAVARQILDPGASIAPGVPFTDGGR